MTSTPFLLTAALLWSTPAAAPPPAAAGMTTPSPNEALQNVAGTSGLATATPRLLRTLRAGRAPVGAVVFGPDGRFLYSGGGEGLIQRWGVPGGQRGAALRQPAAVTALALSPDGQTLAAAGADGRVRVWNAGRGVLLHTLELGSYYVTAVAFSPDGRVLATAGGDNSRQAGSANSVRLWDVSSGQLSGSLVGHTDVVTSVAFSPDGRVLASGSRDRTVRLWDVAGRVPLRTLEGHGDYVSAVAFRPGGTTLASASWDTRVRLWSAQDGRLLAELRGHAGPVTTLAFAPDGLRLASGGQDRQTLLWNVPAATRGAALPAGAAGVGAVAFGPGGVLATAGGPDGQVRLWAVEQPRPAVSAPGAEPARLVFSGVQGQPSTAQEVVIRNPGGALRLERVRLAGADAGAFELVSPPTFPLTLEAGRSLTLAVRQAPGGRVGALHATLSAEGDSPPVEVALAGLRTRGEQGDLEPPLAQIVDALGYRVDVGSPGLLLGTGPGPVGSEVAAPLFRRAGPGPVTLRPVARYSPDGPAPYGTFLLNGDTPRLEPRGTLAPGHPQTLNPPTLPGDLARFEPGDGPFGVYLAANAYAAQATFSLDTLNTGPTRHGVRVYPLRDGRGQPLPHSYLLCFEPSTNGDYQDAVFVLENVTAVAPR